MKKYASRLFFALTAVGCLLAVPARADLGLAQIVANQGAAAVGQAVLAAARGAYVGTSDPAVIQNRLIVILNEVAATGNEQAVRYAIVAVMMAGGVENLGLSTTAINNSNVFASYETITVRTVAATKSLMLASGGAGGTGEGLKGGGDGKDGGGGDSKTLGGGSAKLFLREVDPNDPFTWGSLTGPGDNDLPATGI